MVGDVKQSIYRFRQAAPELFIAKYNQYAVEPNERSNGIRIDLARNFRSRREVVAGINDVFREIMHTHVAEIEYDQRAELKFGATYYETGETSAHDLSPYAAEFVVINRGGGQEDEQANNAASVAEGENAAYSTESADEGDARSAELQAELEEMQQAQLEARYIGLRIQAMRRENPRLEYRDIVILLRADKAVAPAMVEELQKLDVPVYAQLSTGYFDATEVKTVLSLLKIIDNPLQDIPLAAVLRSPLVGLHGEALAQVRLAGGRSKSRRSASGSLYMAVQHVAEQGLVDAQITQQLQVFLHRLDTWRKQALELQLPELLWQIYNETGYYDYVGGMVGGAQRQANLRALYDRAAQYEATSMRGLFRFLRFIERMQARGGDLGNARALSEQEDVVRIMTVHKSKGLEFPVVFVAGMAKQFNEQDLNATFLLHKELGFAPKMVDPTLRVSYPTLPYLAVREQMRMENLAEEMRILYVALTRAKEKLILLGTLRDASAQIEKWSQQLENGQHLAEHAVAGCKRWIDWVGPLVMGGVCKDWVKWVITPEYLLTPHERQVNGEQQSYAEQDATQREAGRDHVGQDHHDGLARDAGVRSIARLHEFIDQAAQASAQSAYAEEVDERLSWTYPHLTSTRLPAKTTVTEMKRLHAAPLDDEDEAVSLVTPALSVTSPKSVTPKTSVTAEAATPRAIVDGGTQTVRLAAPVDPTQYTLRLTRPQFMQGTEQRLSATERGSVWHLVMMHVPLDHPVTRQVVHETVERLIARKMLTSAQAKIVNEQAVLAFFQTEIGQRVQAAADVQREVPFSATFPAGKVYPQQQFLQDRDKQDMILIQGVIDCLFRDEAGRLVLIDYKTDSLQGTNAEAAAERHRFQLTLYADALLQILGEPVYACYVYFFAGKQAIRLF
jgi:ATP-dependent helicase/nuclease subunit A